MKFDLHKIVRPNILALKPYRSLREKIQDEDFILLEANESPFGEFNRYPDPQQNNLKYKLAEINDVKPDQLFLGNGSDELIDLLMRAFCEPGKDAILVMDPGFVMYRFYAQVNNLKVINLKLDKNFQLDQLTFDEINTSSAAKILFLCSPNNPTGNSVFNLEYYISQFKGIVVLDEAYIEFSTQKSVVGLIKQYPNLIVLKTLSKAWAMAGLRIGIGISSSEIAALMNLLKPPYNMSSESQRLALNVLNRKNDFEEKLNSILEEKIKLEIEFSKLDCVVKVYPSDANFYLVELKDAEKVFHLLMENKILTSLRHPALKNCLRVTVGLPSENLKLIEILKNSN